MIRGGEGQQNARGGRDRREAGMGEGWGLEQRKLEGRFEPGSSTWERVREG